jgi:hypothetical protein
VGVQVEVRRTGTLASDADRERCVRRLRAHFAAGRLDVEAFERRVARAERATTKAQLRGLCNDLPAERGRRAVEAVDRADRLLLRGHAGLFVVGNAALVGIWALTGAGAFWPAFVLVPTAGLIGLHAACSWAWRRLTEPWRR